MGKKWNKRSAAADSGGAVRSVPSWVEQAIVVSNEMDGGRTVAGDSLGLGVDVVAALELSQWFPVQVAVIPALLRDACQSAPLLPPRDVCVATPTGSGKTLCYVLPIVEALRGRLVERTRALVVVPTRDLAAQVHAVFARVCAKTRLHAALLGDAATSSRSPDVLVCTPGALVDRLLGITGGAALDLTLLRFLVIDEADRVLTCDGFDWLRLTSDAVYLASSTAANVSLSRQDYRKGSVGSAFRGVIPLQKILLSATLTFDAEVLQQCGLFQPRLFRSETAPFAQAAVEPLTLPTSIHHHFMKTSNCLRPLALFAALKQHPSWSRVVCFCNSKESGRRLSCVLRNLFGGDGVAVAFCSSLLARLRRRALLRRFVNEPRGVLVCSDMVARGMDLEGVDCVVNYSCVDERRAYAHRAGRTGRAGKPGTVLTLLTDEQLSAFRAMLLDCVPEEQFSELQPDEQAMTHQRPAYKEALRLASDQLQTRPMKKKRW